MVDARLGQLHELMAAAGDPADAAIQQRYHKSELRFHGIKAVEQDAILREVFPARRLSRAEHLPLAQALWRSAWFDERVAALWLMERLARELTPEDLPWLHGMTRDCQGWALADYLTTRVLGPLALAHSEPVYDVVRGWSTDEWLWTRRAAVLVHAIPARRGKLSHAHAWPTWEERLGESEWFMRKAVGWALRECCRHYAPEVRAFVAQHRAAMSPLTLREATRKLPPE